MCHLCYFVIEILVSVYRQFFMKSYYIYTDNGKMLGPMDETAVRSLIEANMLSADTQICLAGTEDWLALAEIFPADSVLCRKMA